MNPKKSGSSRTPSPVVTIACPISDLFQAMAERALTEAFDKRVVQPALPPSRESEFDGRPEIRAHKYQGLVWVFEIDDQTISLIQISTDWP